MQNCTPKINAIPYPSSRLYTQGNTILHLYKCVIAMHSLQLLYAMFPIKHQPLSLFYLHLKHLLIWAWNFSLKSIPLPFNNIRYYMSLLEQGVTQDPREWYFAWMVCGYATHIILDSIPIDLPSCNIRGLTTFFTLLELD